MNLTLEELEIVYREVEHWRHIRNRCNNPHIKNYKDYGGRGIKMFPTWDIPSIGFALYFDYVSQLEHFGEPGYSLDRIDNDGNYALGNLRWADSKTQVNNRRDVVKIRDNGQTLNEIADEIGINRGTMRTRWKTGDRGERLRRPLEKREIFIDNGETVKEISAAETGHTEGTIRARYKQGDRGDELRRPIRTRKKKKTCEKTSQISLFEIDE